MIINYNGTNYDADDELSYKDFTGWEFKSRSEYDFNKKIIYASCFCNETPDIEIFNNKTKGATFIKCNLMNVVIPDGNTVIDCLTQQFREQNDREDWVIDKITKDPIEPINKKQFEQLGISIDPADIPLVKQDESAILKGIKEKELGAIK